MKAIIAGLCLIIAVGAEAAVFNGNPGIITTLTPSGEVYTFSETFDWSLEATPGNWASKAYSYSNCLQDPARPNVVVLPASTPGRGTLIYRFVIPVSNATIEYSVMLRRGVAMNVRPNDGVNYGSSLAVGGTDWGTFTGTIPANLLDRSVPGQVSFELRLMNEGSSNIGQVDNLALTATPVEGGTTNIFDGTPGNTVTMELSGDLYTFSESYDWSVDTLIGGWADRAYSYTYCRQDWGTPNSLALGFFSDLQNTYRGTILYRFVVPAANASISYSVAMRRGVTLKVRPNDGVSYGSSLAVGGTDWGTFTGTIPVNLLDRTISGQTSFELRLMNEGSSNLGGIDSLSLTASWAPVPDSVDASTFGYDPEDATDALQSAIYTGARVVYVPAMASDWIVRPITLISNQEIVFAPGVNVVAKRGEFHNRGDCLFRGTGLTNLKLTGTDTVFRMWKTDYTNPSEYLASEQRHGIRLAGCSNVTISGITVRETGGDGIYLGASSGPCSNVRLLNVVCDNNYRQGMSVISVNGLTAEQCTFRATSGTDPMCGIDFEPNNADEVLSNITLAHCIFESNQACGIIFSTRNLAQPDNYQARTENCTFYGNQAAGLSLYLASSSLVVKDCLFVNNPCGIASSGNTFSPTYSGFWGNTAISSGPVSLGTGCLTNVQPLFGSTAYGDADYMYLAASCPAAITTGASDADFMGARPIVGAVLPTPTPAAVPTPTPIPTPTTVPTPTPTPALVPGDADRDGAVTFADFAALQNHYGQSVTDNAWGQGDFNGDGRVTFEDFSILQNHYGETGAAGIAAGTETLSGVPCAALGLSILTIIGLCLLSLKGRE